MIVTTDHHAVTKQMKQIYFISLCNRVTKLVIKYLMWNICTSVIHLAKHIMYS